MRTIKVNVPRCPECGREVAGLHACGPQERVESYDSDHTALVHVLWDAQRGGITISDPDALAAQIMASKWFRAVRLHARSKS